MNIYTIIFIFFIYIYIHIYWSLKCALKAGNALQEVCVCESASECVLERGWPLWCCCFEIVFFCVIYWSLKCGDTENGKCSARGVCVCERERGWPLWCCCFEIVFVCFFVFVCRRRPGASGA